MIKIHHNKKLFWTIIFLIIVLIGVLILIRYLEAKKLILGECLQDSDCVKRQISCCPCSSGGQEVCLSKTNMSYLDNLNKCPAANQLICAQVYNCRQTSCSCINNKCVEK